MLWGYAGVWPKEFTRGRPRSLVANAEFVAEWGLDCTGAPATWLDQMEPGERDTLLRVLDENHLCLTLGVWTSYFGEVDEVARHLDEALAAVARWKDRVRAPIVTTGAGNIHRFVREPSLTRQMDLLAERLPLLVQGCAALGIRVGIENHGDYYCSDLVELCGRVPGLGIFLDTGNTYLIGEASLPAIRAAAPFTVGTHFKDHIVAPRLDARPLHFEVGPAVLGEGDVGLREAYDILLELAPDPPSLVMEIEMVPPPELDPLEAMRRSVEFIRSLPVPVAEARR